MTQSLNLSNFAAYLPKSLIVAYDSSNFSRTSLEYAALLSKQFGSKIHLISVQNPTEYAQVLEEGPYARNKSKNEAQIDVQQIEKQLKENGIQSDSVQRVGNVSDNLWEYTNKLKPDLLLFGAYGYSRNDRNRLGSTAEHLLRTVRCPAWIIGPHAILSTPQAPTIRHILCATTSLESPDDIITFAAHFAGQLKAHLELLHVVDNTLRDKPEQHYERWCEDWCRKIRQQNISASWTLLYGRPDESIYGRASEAKTSLVIFALHRRGNRMIDCPDGVVSETIRQVQCPVMTVPMG